MKHVLDELKLYAPMVTRGDLIVEDTNIDGVPVYVLSRDIPQGAGIAWVADAVVVVGAGFSFEAGMPLSGQLPPLVWHA